MPKDILPPKTPTILSVAENNRVRSANREVYENTMLDLAEGKYLTQLGIDLGVPRPAAFFGDDDRWRAVIRALAFNVRHHRDAVRRVVELVLAPYISQATILDRDTNRTILVNQTLGITSGANVGNYTIEGVTPHEVIFSAGTFAVIPEAGPITYDIGPGTPPSAGATSGLDGFLYVHQDGTERFRDNTQIFMNYARENILTTLNTLMPQYGTVVFDMNSPFEETVILEYYDNKSDGLAKLKGVTLQHTHTKTLPFYSSTLNIRVETGDLTLTLRGGSGANFPVNTVGVAAVTAGDTIEIMEGPNVGSYVIGAVTGTQLQVPGILAVTGAHAQNRYRITPIAVPAGSKGTVLGRGGIVSDSGGAGPSFFRDPFTEFDGLVDPYLAGPPVDRNYSIIINRGEANEEAIEVTSRAGDILTLVLDPADRTDGTSLLKFDHEIGESVEVTGLPVLATGTYAPINATTITGVATAGLVTQLDQATAIFDVATYVDSDVEIITAGAGFIVPRFRTIDAVGPVTRLDWIFALPAVVQAGDTYRIIKRYKAGVDDTIYLDDASFLPAANFTAILDRGRPTEEVVWVASNTPPPAGAEAGFPWALVLDTPATVAQDHEMNITVELAQVLVQGCDWEIIETRATGEFTLLVDKGCIEELGVKDATYLHPLIPALAAGTTAATTANGNAGEDFIEMALIGANSYATAIETVEDLRQGEIFRPIVIDNGNAGEEYSFVSRQRRFTKVAVDFSIDGPAQSFLEVDDVTSFVGYVPPFGATVVISRNSTHPNAGVDTLVIASIFTLTTPHRINFTTPLTASHFVGDTIEIDPVELSLADVLSNTHLFPINVELLYTVEDPGAPPIPRYKHNDPYDIASYVELHDGHIRDGVGESYFADSGQASGDGIDGKPVYPGSYLFGLIDKFQTTINQPSSLVTRLASAHDPNNLDAMFNIPGQKITTAIVNISAGGGNIVLADTELYPAGPQNPFYVILDRGTNIEERLEIAGIGGLTLSIDITQPVKYTHPVGATVDLEISKLLLIGGGGVPDAGGIYFDYGFNGNEAHIEDVEIVGAQDGPANNGILVDNSATFQDYYDDPNALVGAKIHVVHAAGVPAEETTFIGGVLSNTTVTMFPLLVNALAPLDTYTIYAAVLVDNEEEGTDTGKVGGIHTDIGAMANVPPTVGISHPARKYNGVVEEYARYISRDGSVLTLAVPTIFENPHPAETEVIIASNEYSPQGDGSDYPAYLVGNYLEAIFNSQISTLPDLMRAAGIDLKVEVKDA